MPTSSTVNSASQPRASTWGAEFHALMLSAAATGAVLALSAGDFGPFAPLLIALGLCSVLFAMTGEAFLACAMVIRWLRHRRAAAQTAGEAT